MFNFLNRKRLDASGYPVEVVGESFSNDDGTSRQKIIKKLAVGNSVSLVHDKDNKHSQTAVAVISSHGQIGFLPSESRVKEMVLEMLSKNITPNAKIISIGTGDSGLYGVVLDVFKND